MKIREMLPSNYDAAYALWRSIPGVGLNDTDDSRAGIEKYLNRNPGTSFAAEAGGGIVGTILAGHDGRRGFIHHLAVSTRHRRQGVAAKLVEAAVAALKTLNVTKIGILVFADNDGGNAFWEKQGFTLRTDANYRNKAFL